jgi:hypothetical protein
MAYRVKYHREAKSSLDAAQHDYGPTFRQETNAWLSELVSEAERGNHSLSVDAKELLEAAADADPQSLRRSWKRWLSAPALDKLRALLVIVRKRCPPWELRAAPRLFSVVDSFSCEIVAFYEIDHVEGRVIFRHFDGLPGQG